MPNLKELLKDKLTEDELKLLRRSFDVVGDIAIIEIPPELEHKEKIIAEALLSEHKNIKVVAKKASKVEGVERIRRVKVIAGENRTITLHKENGIVLKVDVNKVYFSPRLSSERLRILNQVKDGERIIDMFAGVGPYSILIAKNKDVEIDAIDINPHAYQLLLENMKLNKLKGKIVPHLGDAAEVIKTLRPADRIIMNLPEKAVEYLNLAASKIKNGGIIHLYTFLKEGEKPKLRGYNIVKIVKCGEYGPHIYRYCLDIAF